MECGGRVACGCVSSVQESEYSLWQAGSMRTVSEPDSDECAGSEHIHMCVRRISKCTCLHRMRDNVCVLPAAIIFVGPALLKRV